ncbi:MAG: efflux RND transporter periplasmic adaptor subunit, partial [Pseudomonadales bacterium]
MRSIYVVVGLMYTIGACAEAESGNNGNGAGGGPPGIPVEVAVAVEDTVTEEIFATGQIEALQAIELRPEVEGRLVEIYAREGSEVTSGTRLFKVDDVELRAQVARLEADADLARQALRRTRELMDEGASSEADLEQAEARARSTAAQLQLQQIRLERTVVRAPFTGVVGERFVSLGDYVSSTTRLVTLQTFDPQRVAFDIPERYASLLAVGQEVNFKVAAVPDREF